jgi:hypothetical protein
MACRHFRAACVPGALTGTVVRLGLITGAPAQNAQLAMYSDVGGNPNALVASPSAPVRVVTNREHDLVGGSC